MWAKQRKVDLVENDQTIFLRCIKPSVHLNDAPLYLQLYLNSKVGVL